MLPLIVSVDDVMLTIAICVVEARRASFTISEFAWLYKDHGQEINYICQSE